MVCGIDNGELQLLPMENRHEFSVDWRRIPKEWSYRFPPYVVRSYLENPSVVDGDPHIVSVRTAALEDLARDLTFDDSDGARGVMRERMVAYLMGLRVNLPDSSPALIYTGWDGCSHIERRHSEMNTELIAESGCVNFFRLDGNYSEILRSLAEQGLLDRTYLGVLSLDKKAPSGTEPEENRLGFNTSDDGKIGLTNFAELDFIEVEDFLRIRLSDQSVMHHFYIVLDLSGSDASSA